MIATATLPPCRRGQGQQHGFRLPPAHLRPHRHGRDQRGRAPRRLRPHARHAHPGGVWRRRPCAEIDRLRHFHWDAAFKAGDRRASPTAASTTGNASSTATSLLAALRRHARGDRAGRGHHGRPVPPGRHDRMAHLPADRFSPGTPYFNPQGIHADHLMFPVKEELLVSGEVKMPVMLATCHYYLSTSPPISARPTWCPART